MGLSKYVGYISKAFRSKDHFEFYILRKKHIETGVLLRDKEHALHRVEDYADRRNIEAALSYENESVVAELVSKYVNNEIEYWARRSQAAYDGEFQSRIKAITNRQKSGDYQWEEGEARESGDRFIDKRKKFEMLRNALDTGGIEAYIAAFEQSAK